MILCKNEYSNSLTRPELLPVAVFYGKTQLENVQTPPDRRPGGPQRWRRRRRPYTACTTMWGESITPFAQRVVHAQHANCCLLACLPAWQAGQNNKTAHTKVSFENRATRDERMYLNAFRTWLYVVKLKFKTNWFLWTETTAIFFLASFAVDFYLKKKIIQQAILFI